MQAEKQFPSNISKQIDDKIYEVFLCDDEMPVVATFEPEIATIEMRFDGNLFLDYPS